MQIASCPSLPWFSGPEFAIELVFAFITLIIGFYAYKMFTLSRQKSILLFGIGFLSVSASLKNQDIISSTQRPIQTNKTQTDRDEVLKVQLC